MHRDDDHSAIFVTQLHVASPLASLRESRALERFDRFRAGNDGKLGAQAESSIVEMIGGSSFSGGSTSSK